MENFMNKIDRKSFYNILDYYGAKWNGNDPIPESTVTELLESHVRNKAHIFELFGKQLTISKMVNITVSNREAEEYRDSLCLELTKKFNKKASILNSFLLNLSGKEILSNRILNDMNIFNLKFKSGTKISKIIPKLVLKEHSDEVSIDYSMMNQKLFTSGTAVISIDPIDYITMSSNSSGWRSCHRLNGGEFRTGPIAYLKDSSTVICYIKSSSDTSICGRDEIVYSHSNKRWRQIGLVSPNCDFAMLERQYPSTNASNENAIAEIFSEILESKKKESFKTERVSSGTLNKLHIDYAQKEGCVSFYYNDIDNDMFDYSKIIYPSFIKSTSDILESFELPVKGESVTCLGCGGRLYDADTLFCSYCDCNSDCDDDDF